MTWVVMRREGERSVRVGESVTRAEAEATRRAARLEHPNEDAWIERGGAGDGDDDGDEAGRVIGATRSEPAMLGEAVSSDAGPSQTPTLIPTARVVSPLARPKPRHVPWPARIYMIGPTISAAAAVLLFGGALICAPGGRHGQSMQLFSTHVNDVLGCLGAVWILSAGLVLGVAGMYQARFLRRARVIEGVMTNGKIEITVEGDAYRLASIAPAVPEGTRVPLFWHDSRLVELSKAGARLDPNGEVQWDAKPHPYGAGSWWPGSVLVAGAVILAMLVMLVVALI